MTATNRQIISILLTLLLVISGPALAISEMADSQAESPTMDCGSMGMDRGESTNSPSGALSDCITASEMACLSAGGLSQCGVSFAVLPTDPGDLIDTGSQPVFNTRVTIYQNPFLGFITPPPRHRS